MLNRIARVAIAIPLNRVFDYLIPEALDHTPLLPGIRIRVPFGKHAKIGVLLEVRDHSDIAIEKLKPLSDIIDTTPLLTANDLELLKWASRYYYHALGEVMATAFPSALRQGQAAELKTNECFTLTPAGRACDQSLLKRASKQHQLLAYCQQQTSTVFSSVELAQVISPWRATVNALLSKGLITQAIEADTIPSTNFVTISKPLTANTEQQQAIDSVCAAQGQFQVFLLEGVTGSGKTEVYMQIIQQVLTAQQQVLVLLPEITLTPQLEERFKHRFATTIAISHSGLTDTQRQQAWLLAQCGRAGILLGTRSALFTPVKKLGLIILDEEHDTSFKQQEGFRYSTRDVAIMRAQRLQIPVLLGSATPSLESYANVQRQRFKLLTLAQRAGNATPPKILLLDIRNKPLQEGLSPPLLQAIGTTLNRNEQVLLFLNRRGFAPVVMCHACGWVARCQHCEANLVLHQRLQRLRCHHCGFEQAPFVACPKCKATRLVPIGLGTERVEAILQQLFPNKQIVRLDRDSTQKKGTLENYLEQIQRQQVDIILGTQMLAKGHHFPHVTLVAILEVDSGLFSIDFHAAEKLAQLIMQVAGRAGRAEKPGRVILQTRQPEHPLLQTLIREGYPQFAQQALAERRLAALPPFSYQALLRVSANAENKAQAFFENFKQLTNKLPQHKVLLLGPVPAPMALKAGHLRYQLLLQAAKRSELREVLDQVLYRLEQLPIAKQVNWSLDIDPVDLY